jgi:solute carrier family 13 (sodium-dependent dicarboxylate transporter), member 2/3/5
VPRTRWPVGLFLGPLAFFVILALPIPGLTGAAHAVLATFAWAVVYWVTEAVPAPVTALLSSVLAIVLGIAPAATVLAAYADPVLFLFIGSFILAEAMKTTQLDRRLALALLDHDWATRSMSRLMLAIGIVTCGLSLWMSNTATTAIMLPVGIGVLRAVNLTTATSRFAVGLLLMLTWSSSVAVGVPVGSPPNLIAIGLIRDLTDRRLSFFEWFTVAMPLTVAMLLLVWVLLRGLYGGGADHPADLRAYVAAERARVGPWTSAQRNVLLVFTGAAVLWMLPGAAAMVLSPTAPLPRLLEQRLPESAVALGAAILLFVLPTDVKRGEFTLTWSQASRIDWGTILLFGGGLALGKLMFVTGLASAIGEMIMRQHWIADVWSLTAMSIVVGILLSEASSNTAAASIVVPVVIAVAQSAGLSPIPPALGAALGASFGFMLPVSTPPNAIVYGSGLVPLREMIRSGVCLDAAGAILIWIGLRVLCPLVGVM